MTKYIVDWHIKKTDKRGEYAYWLLKSNNGEKLAVSEKYKNWKFSRKLARHIATDIKAQYKEYDHR